MTPIWVIYKNPTDFPGVAFVMRQHFIEDGKAIIGSKMWRGTTMSSIRRYVPKGKRKRKRSENDEPQIVEWWY
jgi:hypothetical protein